MDTPDDAVVPFKPDIEATTDPEREMLDYLARRLRKYCRETGKAPHVAAVVFLSVDGHADIAHSWSPHDTAEYRTCSVASTLLLKRALDD